MEVGITGTSSSSSSSAAPPALEHVGSAPPQTPFCCDGSGGCGGRGAELVSSLKGFGVVVVAAAAVLDPLAVAETSTRLTASLQPINEPISHERSVTAASPSLQQRQHDGTSFVAVSASTPDLTATAPAVVGDKLEVADVGALAQTFGGRPRAGRAGDIVSKAESGAEVVAGEASGGPGGASQQQQQLARPAARGRKRRAASMVAGDGGDDGQSPPLRRSNRVKHEVDYNELSLRTAVAAGVAQSSSASAANAPMYWPAAPDGHDPVKAEPDPEPVPTATVRKVGKAKAKLKNEVVPEDEGEQSGATGKVVGAKPKPKGGKGSRGKSETVDKGVAATKETTTGIAKKKKRAPRKPKVANPYKDEVENDPTLKDMPQSVKDRIIRVLCQRMFLVNRFRAPGHLTEEFDVLGSIGNVYKVTIASKCKKCTCVDYAIRKQMCKHLIFVFLKVLRLPRHSPVLLDQHMSDDQLIELFEAAMPNPVEEGAQASRELRRAWEVSVGLHKAGQESDEDENGDRSAVGGSQAIPQGKRLLPSEDDLCPVCYEVLDAGTSEDLTFCLSSCGRPLHNECFQQWAQSQSGLSGGGVTCVWCRAPWPKPPAAPAAGSSSSRPQANGYGVGVRKGAVRGFGQTRGVLNLADVAGVSVVRDTSTYKRSRSS